MPQSVLILTNSQYIPPMCGGGTATIWVSRATIFISGTCLLIHGFTIDARTQREGRQGPEQADERDVAEIQLVAKGSGEVLGEVAVDQGNEGIRQVTHHRDDADGQAGDA